MRAIPQPPALPTAVRINPPATEVANMNEYCPKTIFIQPGDARESVPASFLTSWAYGD